MTRPPDYIVHQVDEKAVTVDWFFARGHGRRRITQLALMAVGWLFAILPVVITASALIYRNAPGAGWWHYSEGFRMWDVTTQILEFLVVVFIIVFFSLYVINRTTASKHDKRETYDTARLSRRLELAAGMYDSKYGAREFRLERKKVVIEPYGDVETYELRDLYREYGVD